MQSKMMILFYLFLSLAQLKAEDTKCLGGITPMPKFSILDDLSKHLDWSAASDLDIKKAHCLRRNPVTDDEMKDWLETHQSAPSFSKEINGIKFENESEENLKSFEYLTSVKDFFGLPDREKQKIFSSNCKKVECAVKEIFGSDEGLRLLFMHRKYGLNGSHLVKENSSNWRKDELDHLLIALTDYPEGILPISENRPLVHFKRGYTRKGGDNTIANSIMEIFDLWNEQTPEQKRYTITHELGHGIGGVTKIDDSPQWKTLSDWVETTKVVDGKMLKERHAGDMHTIISKYGQTNQFEDFAESVSAYRYNPKILLEASPKKYNIIKEVIFDNVEFTSEEACKNPKRLSSTLKEKMQKSIDDWTPSQEDLMQASRQCSESVIVRLSMDNSVNLQDKDFQKCYENAINRQAKNTALKILDDYPNREFLAPMFRNLKLDPISGEKLKRIVESVEEIHRKNLKNEISVSLKRNVFFVSNESGEKLKYVYQSFDDKKLGFDSFTRRKEFENLANKISKKIRETHSLRRMLNLDFSESEISEQLELMIR